eukprot:5206922-Lingulodinium_polyedra.AAC.1
MLISSRRIQRRHGHFAANFCKYELHEYAQTPLGANGSSATSLCLEPSCSAVASATMLATAAFRMPCYSGVGFASL